MKVPAFFTRATTFIAALGAGLLLTALLIRSVSVFNAPPSVTPLPPTSRIERTGGTPSTPQAFYKPLEVTLDFEARKTYTTLTLAPDKGWPAAPRKLWVRTRFFAADGAAREGWWTEAVEVDRPTDGEAETITVTAPSPLRDEGRARGANLYARVYVFDEPGDVPPSIEHGARIDNDLADATPVVVQFSREESRR